MSNKTSENIHEENKEHLRNPGKVILVEITSGIVVEGNEICADLCVAVRYRLAVTGGLLVLPWTGGGGWVYLVYGSGRRQPCRRVAHNQYRTRRHVVHVENLPLCYPCLFDTICIATSCYERIVKLYCRVIAYVLRLCFILSRF